MLTRIDSNIVCYNLIFLAITRYWNLTDIYRRFERKYCKYIPPKHR